MLKTRLGEFEHFSEFEMAWHVQFRKECGEKGPPEMYYDGQFDEFPYHEWEQLGGVCNS